MFSTSRVHGVQRIRIGQDLDTAMVDLLGQRGAVDCTINTLWNRDVIPTPKLVIWPCVKVRAGQPVLTSCYSPFPEKAFCDKPKALIIIVKELTKCSSIFASSQILK